MKLDMRSNIAEVIRRVDDTAKKHIPFATSKALNQAVFKGTETAKRKMPQVFDRPTPWVMGGIRYVKSTKHNLTASIDFWGNKQTVSVEQILKAEVYGGARRHKRHEVALQRAGILPPGMSIVPGGAADIDQYGNMRAGQILQIIAWFKAFAEQGYKANLTDMGRGRVGKDKKSGARGFAYFALSKQHGKLLPGVYQRIRLAWGYAVKPVMIFVRQPRYAQRFDFYGLTERVVREEFAATFEAELRQAMRTAR